MDEGIVKGMIGHEEYQHVVIPYEMHRCLPALTVEDYLVLRVGSHCR